MSNAYIQELLQGAAQEFCGFGGNRKFSLWFIKLIKSEPRSFLGLSSLYWAVDFTAVMSLKWGRAVAEFIPHEIRQNTSGKPQEICRTST